jgi:hypothetical protein
MWMTGSGYMRMRMCRRSEFFEDSPSRACPRRGASRRSASSSTETGRTQGEQPGRTIALRAAHAGLKRTGASVSASAPSAALEARTSQRRRMR